jgi:cell division protein FtsQ
VQERQPIAAVPVDSDFALVDEDGVVVETVARRPRGLARVDVDLRTAGPAAMNAALAVWKELPRSLRAHVASIGADTPDGVWLRLDGGALVRWGNAERTRDKVAALAAVRKAEADAQVYDVASPGTPAVQD